MPKQWCRCGFLLAFLPLLSVLWVPRCATATSSSLSSACTTSSSIRTCTLGSSASGWQLDVALGRGTTTVVQSADGSLGPVLSAGGSAITVGQDASFIVRGVQLTDVNFPASLNSSNPWAPIAAVFSLGSGAQVVLNNVQLLLTNCSSVQSYMALHCSQTDGPSYHVEVMTANSMRVDWWTQQGLLLNNVTITCAAGAGSALARMPCTSANVSTALDFMAKVKFAAQADVAGWIGVDAAQLDLHAVDTTKPLTITTSLTIRGFVGQTALPEIDLPPGPLIQPTGKGTVSLQHLSLVNLPFGPPDQMAASALTLNLWSVKFPRLLGALQGTQQLRMSVTNCTLHIPADEMDWLVHWFADLPTYDVDSDFSNNAPVWLSEWLNEANTTLVLRDGPFTPWGVQRQLYLNEWQGRYGWWSISNSTLVSGATTAASRRINSTGILTWIPTRPPVYLPIPNLDKLSDQVMRRDLAVEPGTSPVYAAGQQAYEYALLNDVSMSRESFIGAPVETVIECNISCIGVPEGQQTMDMRGLAGAARIASNASIAFYNVRLMNLGTFWGERPATSTLGSTWTDTPPHPLVNFTLPMWFFTADSSAITQGQMQIWLRGTRLLVPAQEFALLKDFATKGSTSLDVSTPAADVLRAELYGKQVNITGNDLVFPLFSFLHLRGRNVTISSQDEAVKAGLPFPAVPNTNPSLASAQKRPSTATDSNSATEQHGLSAGARLGIILGVVLGFIAIMAAVATLLLVRFRQQKRWAPMTHGDLEAHILQKDGSDGTGSGSKSRPFEDAADSKCGSSPRLDWPSSPLHAAPASGEAVGGTSETNLKATSVTDIEHGVARDLVITAGADGRGVASHAALVGTSPPHSMDGKNVTSHDSSPDIKELPDKLPAQPAGSHGSTESLLPHAKADGHSAGHEVSGQSNGTGTVQQRTRPQEEMARALQAFGYEMGGGAVELHALIGKGAYGAVYAGTWKGLQVAIKRLLVQHVCTGDQGDNPQLNAIQEAALNASLNHPNIITTYTTELHEIHSALSSKGSNSAGSAAPMQKLEEWHLYIIQEYCDGGSLADALGQHRFLPASPTRVQREAALDNVLLLAINIAAGMAYLHSKLVVHGDLKPDNILLKNTPTVPHGCVAKVCDFGLSVKMEVTQTHVSGVRHGTPLYIAPEVLKHSKVSASSDTYSFGVILWELWHGELAWDFLIRAAPQMTGLLLGGVHMMSLSQLLPFKDPEVHPGYVALCQACLHPDPSQRPSFEAAVELLCAFMVGRMHRHPTLVAACQGHAAALARGTQSNQLLPSTEPTMDKQGQAALAGIADGGAQTHGDAGALQQSAPASRDASLTMTLLPPSSTQLHQSSHGQSQQRQQSDQAWHVNGVSQQPWPDADGTRALAAAGTSAAAHVSGSPANSINTGAYTNATAAAAAGVQMVEQQQQGLLACGTTDCDGRTVHSQGSCPHAHGGVCIDCRRASSQHVIQVVTSYAWGMNEGEDDTHLSTAAL